MHYAHLLQDLPHRRVEAHDDGGQDSHVVAETRDLTEQALVLLGKEFQVYGHRVRLRKYRQIALF
jgi:hypothetical protein